MSAGAGHQPHEAKHEEPEEPEQDHEPDADPSTRLAGPLELLVFASRPVQPGDHPHNDEDDHATSTQVILRHLNVRAA